MTENEVIEYKESLTQLKKAIISISAILNKHTKGRIIFGVKDTGSVVGVSVGAHTLRDIAHTISQQIEPTIYPLITTQTREQKTCVSIEFSGEDTPYFAYGRAYKRVSDVDKAITKAELERMFLSRKKTNWDCETTNAFTLADISDTKLKSYVEKVGLAYTSQAEVLEKLGLYTEQKLPNSSVLLFGKKPSTSFPLLNLRCAVFAGIDKASPFVDMKEFHGDLFELIEYAQQYILQHINISMRLVGLRRVDVPEINLDAVREAIVNAFCHRDYSIKQEIQIAVFKDRVEILNPGGLLNGLEITDIITKRISKRRNELIADIFHRIQYVEKWGTGISKITKLEPQATFESFSDFFMVTFRRKGVESDTNRTQIGHKTDDETRQEWILNYVKENKSIRSKDIIQKFKIVKDTASRDLHKLIAEHKIVKKGAGNNVWYELP